MFVAGRNVRLRRMLALAAAVAIWLVPLSARASNVLCCDLINRSCSFSSYSGVVDVTTVSKACPIPDENGWMLSIATVDATGGATVGMPITSPPFHGVCLVPAGHTVDYVVPDSCIPLTPTGGLRAEPGRSNVYMAVGANVIGLGTKQPHVHAMCYLGDRRIDETYGFSDRASKTLGMPPGTSPATYSCTGQTFLNTIPGHEMKFDKDGNLISKEISEGWSNHVPDLDDPPLLTPRLLPAPRKTGMFGASFGLLVMFGAVIAYRRGRLSGPRAR
jgi:hypothetical protein